MYILNYIINYGTPEATLVHSDNEVITVISFLRPKSEVD